MSDLARALATEQEAQDDLVLARLDAGIVLAELRRHLARRGIRARVRGWLSRRGRWQWV